MRRLGGADFAPGADVFPGGVVHNEDFEWGDAIAAAAIRELFEEVGILLARDGSRFARDRDCELVRASVSTGSSLSGALRAHGLGPTLDQLLLLTPMVT